jgi:hypothetical protein
LGYPACLGEYFRSIDSLHCAPVMRGEAPLDLCFPCCVQFSGRRLVEGLEQLIHQALTILWRERTAALHEFRDLVWHGWLLNHAPV